MNQESPTFAANVFDGKLRFPGMYLVCLELITGRIIVEKEGCHE